MNTLVLVIFLAISSATAQPELEIRPRGDEFIRPVDSNIVFTCSVVNVSPTSILQIQWYDVHGRDIVDTAGQGRRMYIESDGVTTKKLFINVAQEHEGEYTCTATVDSSRQSKNVRLNLYKEITFDEAPATQHPTQFTDALIKCQVSGQPVPSVTWRYRGSRINTVGRYTQDMYGLRIQNITVADDGIYNCRAEVDSDGRYDERPITVEVYTRPSSVQGAPYMFEGEAYQEFSITCQATGYPAPTYQFYKDGNESPISQTERVELNSVAGAVHFRPLHWDDAGRYQCVAYNDAGNVSTELSLRVQVPPNIRSMVNITSVEGQSASLVCQSEGHPEPSMTFRKVGSRNEYRMGENDDGRIVMSYLGAGRLELNFTNLKPEDMANYTCQSTNVVGNRELTGQLIVNFKPRFASDHATVVHAWAGKARNITCHVKAEPAPLFDWLKNDQLIEDSETYKVFKTGKVSNLQVNFRETDQSWIFGTYICRARNDYGTAEQRITLSRGMAPGAPRNLRTLFISTTRVVLAVDEPFENGGADILGYRINYDQNRVAEFQSGDRMPIENLRPSTTYIFQVQARNEVNLGQPDQLLVTTGDVGPPSKIDLTCNPMGDSAYEYQVTWRKPETGGVPISLYEFRLRKLIGKPGLDGPMASEEWIKLQSTNDPDVPLTYYTLGGLEPQTWYQLEVVAFNSIGWSPPNDQFSFQTRDGDSLVETLPPSPGQVVPSSSARYNSWASLMSFFVPVLIACVLSTF